MIVIVAETGDGGWQKNKKLVARLAMMSRDKIR